MSHPFVDPTLRDWCLDCLADAADPVPNTVVTDGSGPFAEEEFDGFLARLGVAVRGIDEGEGTGDLVLGTEDWDRDELDQFLWARAGDHLRVYSQEMMLAFLMTGRNPFLYGREVCLAFGRGHPALEYLQEWGFEWPQTDIVPGLDLGDPCEPEAWPTVGLLKHYGYQVGAYGKGLQRRRAILRSIYCAARLDRVVSPAYMAAWGAACSDQRLRKMADSIASFARNQKRKAYPPHEAIRDWEDDLDWLRDEFYRGRFAWPSTYVHT